MRRMPNLSVAIKRARTPIIAYIPLNLEMLKFKLDYVHNLLEDQLASVCMYLALFCAPVFRVSSVVTSSIRNSSQNEDHPSQRGKYWHFQSPEK